MNEGLKDHINLLLKSDTRLDGRKALDYRKPLKVEYGFTGTAQGSALVTMGKTIVSVGVKVEVGTPYPDHPDEGTIMVGAELLPLSNPDFESGPPRIEAIELARIVDRAIRESKAIDFKKLCIKEGEKVWILIIDICPLNDDGNLKDASSLAALAALRDFKFPKYDEEKGVIEYKEKTDKGIDIAAKDPLDVTIIKIGDNFLIDPDYEEEKAIEARLTVGSTKDGKLCALQKGGDYPLTEEDISKMLDLGIEKAKELRGAL